MCQLKTSEPTSFRSNTMGQERTDVAWGRLGDAASGLSREHARQVFPNRDPATWKAGSGRFALRANALCATPSRHFRPALEHAEERARLGETEAVCRFLDGLARVPKYRTRDVHFLVVHSELGLRARVRYR